MQARYVLIQSRKIIGVKLFEFLDLFTNFGVIFIDIDRFIYFRLESKYIDYRSFSNTRYSVGQIGLRVCKKKSLVHVPNPQQKKIK